MNEITTFPRQMTVFCSAPLITLYVYKKKRYLFTIYLLGACRYSLWNTFPGTCCQSSCQWMIINHLCLCNFRVKWRRRRRYQRDRGFFWLNVVDVSNSKPNFGENIFSEKGKSFVIQCLTKEYRLPNPILGWGKFTPLSNILR